VARARIEASAVIDLNVASVRIEQSVLSVLSVLIVLSVANEAIAGIEPKREENVTNVASERIDQNGATEGNGQNATSVENEQSATSVETVWSAGVATITTTRTRMHRKPKSSGQPPLQQQMTLPWSLILD
jgi:hypothetical protein